MPPINSERSSAIIPESGSARVIWSSECHADPRGDRRPVRFIPRSGGHATPPRPRGRKGMKSPDEGCTFETFGVGGEANFTQFSGGGTARATQGMHSASRLMLWIAKVPAAAM